MAEPEPTLADPPADFVDRVRTKIVGALAELCNQLSLSEAQREALTGKLLRTRLAGSLLPSPTPPGCFVQAVDACAAVELLHTASLCHDDLIDGASVRRHQPALWRVRGVRVATLGGDAMLAESLLLLTQSSSTERVRVFIRSMHEICEAELKVERGLRHRRLDRETWLALARAKTGPLFAFAAAATAGGSEPDDRRALTEAGYRVGVSYQILDDLLDRLGTASGMGKSAHRDVEAGVLTPIAWASDPVAVAAEALEVEWAAAVDALSLWPDRQAALRRYGASELRPVVAAACPEVAALLA